MVHRTTKFLLACRFHWAERALVAAALAPLDTILQRTAKASGARAVNQLASDGSQAALDRVNARVYIREGHPWADDTALHPHVHRLKLMSHLRANPPVLQCARVVTAALFGALVVAAFTTPAATDTFEVREIAPGVFVHEGRYETFAPSNAGDTSNSGFIVGDKAVAVVDTGGSAHVGEALLRAIRSHTQLPIKYVINTHMHPDHVFGNAAFEGERPAVVGHHKLARALAARASHYLAINEELLGKPAFAGTRIVPPTLPVEDKLELDLGGRTIVVEAHKTAHTDNDVTVFDKTTGTLFLGDLLFAKHVPALDGSIRGWLAFLDQLETRKDVARVVPGHGPASIDWPDSLAAQKRYLAKVADDVRALIKQGKTLTEAMSSAGLSERDAWLLFKEYHSRNVSAAFAELEWE